MNKKGEGKTSPGIIIIPPEAIVNIEIKGGLYMAEIILDVAMIVVSVAAIVAVVKLWKGDD